MRHDLGGLIAVCAARYGDDVAFQVRRGFRRERITYRQVGEHARCAAAWLAAQGLQPGDRVAVWAPNMPEYAVLCFGAWLAGMVVVPIDVRTRPEVVDRFVTAAGARLGFTSRAMAGRFNPPVTQTFLLEDLLELVACAPPLDPPPAAGPDAVCEIVFTSGTTGTPKGVLLTHGNLLAEIAALRAAFPLRRSDRALSVLPLSHAFEQVIGLWLPFTCGARITYLPRVNAVTIAGAMQEDAITVMAVVPELLRLLLTGIERRIRQTGEWERWQRGQRLAGHLPFPLRRLLFRPVHQALGGRLRLFGCGGAPLDPKLATAWERMGVRIFEGYGLTETMAASTINTRTDRRLGTAGRPVPGVAVRIAADGEVLIRGRTVTSGYLDDADLTARSLTDGWFHTGDVGYLDADGFLHISGRQAFKIVLADGRNVYPEDIEQALSKHPLVRESCVVGIERNGAETVHAALLTDNPARAGDIVRAVNRTLAAHQQITSHSVWPAPDFPRTPMLKVDRRQVRAAIERHGVTEAALRPAGAAAAGDPLVGLIARIAERPAANVLDGAELEADLGLDSLGRVELLSAIEEELGRAVHEILVGPQTTVGELRRRLDEGTVEGVAPAGARWPRAWWARALRRALLWAAFRAQDRWLRIEVVHPERAAALPLPAILIFNYQGPYVPLVMLRTLPARIRSRVAIAADARLWQGRDRWQGYLAALGAQAFSFVKSGGAVRASLAELGRWLDDGYAVIVSPEGDPEQAEQLRPFLGGAGMMAVALRAPIVPFRVEGYGRLFPADPSFPFLPNKRGRVRVVIGEPITLPASMSAQEATARARQALIETR